MKRIALFAALTLAACQGPPSDVEAIQKPLTITYTNDFGVISIAGNTPCAGNLTCPTLLFWRQSDSLCQEFSLGGYSQMSFNVDVISGTNGGAGWSNMAAVGAGQTRDVWCSNTGNRHFTALSQNGYSVTLQGGPNADYLNCSGNGGPVWCFGMGGNDIMEDTMNQAVSMFGGDGDDRIRVLSLPVGLNAPSLFGEAGNDCLTSPSSQSWRDCGTGSDISNMSGNNCETITPTTCP